MARQRDDDVEAVFGELAHGRVAAAVAASRASPDPRLLAVLEGLQQPPTSLLASMQIAAGRLIDRAENLQWVLGTLITLAPLLGLLGTITGIMGSFSVIGEEQLAATKVSGGIAEALIATACGLGIAILCLIPFNYFNRRIVRLRRSMERIINRTEALVVQASAQVTAIQTPTTIGPTKEL